MGVGLAIGVAETYQGGALGAGALFPDAFTARSLKRYSVPFVRPVTAYDVVPGPLLGTAVHSPQPGAGGAARCWYS